MRSQMKPFIERNIKRVGSWCKCPFCGAANRVQRTYHKHNCKHFVDAQLHYTHTIHIGCEYKTMINVFTFRQRKSEAMESKTTTIITKAELEKIITDYLTNVKQINAGKVLSITVDCTNTVFVDWEG